MKKKHKSRSSNDRGAVLSLDDVKHHVSIGCCRVLWLRQTALLWQELAPFFFVSTGLNCRQSGWCWRERESEIEKKQLKEAKRERCKEKKSNWDESGGLRGSRRRGGLGLIKAAGQYQQGQARIKASDAMTAYLYKCKWNRLTLIVTQSAGREKWKGAPPLLLPHLVVLPLHPPSLFFQVLLRNLLFRRSRPNLLVFSFFFQRHFQDFLTRLHIYVPFPSKPIIFLLRSRCHSNFFVFFSSGSLWQPAYAIYISWEHATSPSGPGQLWRLHLLSRPQ